MDKIKALSEMNSCIADFRYEDVAWKIGTGFGDVMLEKTDERAIFILDPRPSSVINLSLMIQAIKGELSKVSYKLLLKEDGESVLIEIVTEKENLVYAFHRKGEGNIEEYLEQIRLLMTKCLANEKKQPILGIFKSTSWKEYGLFDWVIDFDYSFLNLEHPPLIFVGYLNNKGYVAVAQKTNTSCKLYVNWNPIVFQPIKVEDIIFEYCIFPFEGPQAFGKEEKKQNETPITSYDQFFEEIAKGRKLCVFEDSVLDIERFATRHPGLAERIRGCVGREIGRWMYGSFESLEAKHTHSAHAIDLVNKYIVGKIEEDIWQKVHSGMRKGEDLRDYVFSFGQLEGVTDLQMLLKFSNEKIKLLPLQCDVKHFGKYYAITSLVKKVTRNYACVHMGGEETMKEHLILVNAVQHQKEYKSPFSLTQELEINYIPIIVSEMGSYSEWLVSEAQENSEFLIGGPFGSGLGLNPQEKGTIVAICGGLSLMLFFDLILYLFRMNAAKIDPQYCIFPKESFEQLSDPSFKLVVLSSFRSVSVPYIRLLHAANNLKAPNFQFHLRISEKDPEYWSTEYFKTTVPRDAKKIFITGDQTFISSVSENLSEAGFSSTTFAPL